MVVEVVVRVNGIVSGKSNDLNLMWYGSVFVSALNAHMVDLCGLHVACEVSVVPSNEVNVDCL